MSLADPDSWAWRIGRGRGVAVYIISEEVGLREMVEEEFVSEIQKTSAPRLFLIASALSVLRSNRTQMPNHDPVADDVEIATQICTEDTASRICELLRSREPRVFVHDEQLLLLTKAAILHGKDGDEPIDDRLLERLLLGANDLLGRDTGSIEASGDLELKLALRQSGGFRKQPMRYQLGRYYDLLVIRARKALASGSQQNLDARFEEYLRDVVGVEHPVDIETYIGYGMMYYSMFANANRLQDLLHIIQTDRAAQYESKVAVPNIAELRRAFGRTREGLRAGFLGREALERASYIPLRDRPMLLRAEESPIVLSMPFLLDKVSTGVYYSLHQQYLRPESGAHIGDLVSFVGELFQSYLTELLERMYSHLTGMQKRMAFHSEEAIRVASGKAGARDERPPFDGVIVEGDSLITVEMTAISVSLNTIEAANVERFRQEVDRGFRRKFRQIRDTVQGLASGRWVVPGLESSEIRDVFPVLALLMPFPQNPATWRTLYECGKDVWPDWPYPMDRTYEVQSEDGTSFRVHAPQIVTAEEWEELEALLVHSRHYLTTLLRKKLEVRTYSTLEMTEYLGWVLNAPRRVNEYVWEMTESAIDAGIAALGLKEETTEG